MLTGNDKCIFTENNEKLYKIQLCCYINILLDKLIFQGNCVLSERTAE